jgi:tetratricopeptide (TPR) repeat protein
MRKAAFLGVLAGSMLMAGPAAPVRADFDDPKPKIDCTQKKNKSKPACQPQRFDATDDEIYNAAYWMNRSGQFVDALATLRLAKDQDDPRLLNESGFATRKLGDVEAALSFYRRALAKKPDYVFARAYMGEALLVQGDMDGAKAQLAEIERLCGRACPAHAHLSESIAKAAALVKTGG